MFDHITITSENYIKMISFYEKTLSVLGVVKQVEYAGEVVGFGRERTIFWIGISNEKHLKTTNLHLSFIAESKYEVDMFYKTAIENGATDNVKPGYRNDYHTGYYACFVFDLDGNNLEAVFREKN
jgi:catechol 2,3-dioxygenase-like lactoylglutathione lyase family enzyme